MQSFSRPKAILASTMILFSAATALAGPTAAEKCEAGKNDAAGRYFSCVAKAEKTLVTNGDMTKYAEAVAKCDDKYGDKWGDLETKAEGDCPSSGDEASMQVFLDACQSSVAVALGGSPLPIDVLTCNANLTACESLVGTLSTGQETCWNSAGSVVPCLGTGQDGELQRGVARGFTDNGNGTVTDNSTNLMWEKHSDDGTINDKDTVYTWTNAFVRVAQLNTDNFAGHNDWRLPNMFELASLLNMEETLSAYPEFNTSCVPTCTVTTCSCTEAGGYWTSTTSPVTTNWARRVNFDGGLIESNSKAATNRVRAVRGGA